MTLCYRVKWHVPESNEHRHSPVYLIEAPDRSSGREAEKAWRLTQQNVIDSREIEPYQIVLDEMPDAIVLRYRKGEVPEQVALTPIHQREGYFPGPLLRVIPRTKS